MSVRVVSQPFGLVPASFVYLLREGSGGTEVLLQLRRGTPYMNGHWAAGAAGHVERGETAHDTAHREALEELGVSVHDLRFEFTMQRTGHDRPVDERVDFFFSARRWSGEPRIVEPTKCADLRWYPLDALPENTVPQEAYALTQLGSGQAYLTYGWHHHDLASGGTSA